MRWLAMIFIFAFFLTYVGLVGYLFFQWLGRSRGCSYKTYQAEKGHADPIRNN